MKNIYLIQSVIDYIEENMNEALDLDSIAVVTGYSKYHLCRMFASCTGYSIHEYVKRRRLTEAARRLVLTDDRIIDISIEYGYSNQQSFTNGFESVFGEAPAKYRKNKTFSPVQLKLCVSPLKTLQGDHIMNIRTEKNQKFTLVGFEGNTATGFQVIGKCWGQLHDRKGEIMNRTDMDFLVGINDYSNYEEPETGLKSFMYYAGAEVFSVGKIPEGMIVKELPATDYVVFTYKGNCQDSMEPVADYIYKQWFPQSSCVRNENAQYDFVCYGESIDEEGKSTIEYWVPVKNFVTLKDE